MHILVFFDIVRTAGHRKESHKFLLDRNFSNKLRDKFKQKSDDNYNKKFSRLSIIEKTIKDQYNYTTNSDKKRKNFYFTDESMKYNLLTTYPSKMDYEKFLILSNKNNKID